MSQGTYKDVNEALLSKGCISIYSCGYISINTRWFLHAIKSRKDSLKVYLLSDMDLGGIKIQHQLSGSTDFSDPSKKKSAAEYTIQYPTYWMAINYELYEHFLNMNPTGIYLVMTLTQDAKSRITEWVNTRHELINFAGNGNHRHQQLTQMLNNDVRLNLAQIKLDAFLAAIDHMMNNAIGNL